MSSSSKPTGSPQEPEHNELSDETQSFRPELRIFPKERSKTHYKPNDRIGGRYWVRQVVTGGMGEVYLCNDMAMLIGPVALKTFRPRYLTSPKLRTIFEAEVSNWIALEKHPNIVRCFDVTSFDNRPFIVMEWVIGGARQLTDTERLESTDLRGWLRYGPLNVQMALDFTVDICRGLAHAQEKQPGFVHRDLKPKNILVGVGRLAKITDFGLAQVIQAADSETNGRTGETNGRESPATHGQIPGTPGYMAPEQWQEKVLDAGADIYSVGCILYELLTGRQPFQLEPMPETAEQTPQWLAEMRIKHETAQWSSLVADLPLAIGDILRSCLAWEREERPVSAARLLEQLGQVYQQQFGKPPRSVPSDGEFAAQDHLRQGIIHAKLHQYEMALAEYDRAIELDPDEAETYEKRGTAYADLKQYEAALADYGQAIELNPICVPAYFSRGVTYAELQEHERALEDYDRAIEVNSDYANTYFGRPNPYSHYGPLGDELGAVQALAHYQLATGFNPIYVKAYNNRGVSHAALQRYEEALADYSQAIELDPNYAKAYANRGSTYHTLQQYEAALADYDRAIELGSNDAQTYVDRGSAYAGLQRYEEALADYDQAIRLDPNDAQAHYNRGVTYAELQQYEVALVDYNRAIELDPHYAQAYSNRGSAYADLKQYEAALADYERAIELDPGSARAHYNRGVTYAELQQYEAALADYSRAVELDPTYAQAYLNRGGIHADLQQYEMALADYERAIELDPGSAIAHYDRGVTYAELQQYEAALADYSRAVELDPTHAQAYLNRGSAYASLQRYEEALPDFDRAIGLDPTHAQAYNNRGAAYAALQQPEAALTDFGRAIELDSTYAPVYLNRGNTYAALQQPEAALVDYGRAIELDPNDARAYSNRGIAYYTLQQYEAALADYDRAIELDPDEALPYYNRGITHADLKQHKAALADYSRAIELDPNEARAYSNRGATYYELQQPKAALTDYSRAIELSPTYAPYYFRRGTTYDALQQYEAALADYNRAIELDPNYVQAYYNMGALLADRGQLHESLPYFEKAAQFGLPQALLAVFRVRQMLSTRPVSAKQVPPESRPASEQPSPDKVESKVSEIEVAIREAIDWAKKQRKNNIFDPQVYLRYHIGMLLITAVPNVPMQIEGECIVAVPSPAIACDQLEALALRKGWNHKRQDARDVTHIWTKEGYVVDPKSFRAGLQLERGEPIVGPLQESEIASEIVAVNIEIFGLSPVEITIEKEAPQYSGKR